MQEKMFKDLEEMSKRNASFMDYFYKMLEIIDNVEGNQRAVILYKLMADIREIGYKEGKLAEKKELLDFSNSSELRNKIIKENETLVDFQAWAGGIDTKKESMETYLTLSFKTKKQAEKTLRNIISYFENRLVSSEIIKGIDERGNYGFQVRYILSK